jgi:hypothetical protein
MIQLAAQSIDSQLWNSVASLLQKTSKLIGNKKTQEYFMENQVVAVYLSPLSESNEICDAFAELLAVFTSCSLTDQATMKNFSMGRFVANDFDRVHAAGSKMYELLNLIPLDTEYPKVEVVDEMGSEATLIITGSRETREERWVKVGRRWLPANIVESWDDRLKQMREYWAGWSAPEGQANQKLGVMVMKTASSGINGQQLAADSQQAFDADFEMIFTGPVLVLLLLPDGIGHSRLR